MRLVCILFCVLSVLCADEYRELKSQDGKIIKAKVLSVTETKVTIQTEAGDVFKDVPIKRFSATTRAYIREQRNAVEQAKQNADVHTESRLRITFTKGEDDEPVEWETLYGERRVSFKPMVMLESQEIELKYTDIRGTMILVGRAYLDRSEYVILSRQNFSMDIGPRDRKRWNSKGVSTLYASELGGYQYGGYIVILRNRKGEIVKVESSREAWKQAPELLLNAKTRTGYNYKFTESYALESTYGL